MRAIGDRAAWYHRDDCTDRPDAGVGTPSQKAARAENNAVLKVENLSTHFVTPRGTVRAVDRVSLGVGRGEVVGLVGETGSGKSVTAASILNLVRPPGTIIDGRIVFEGEDLLKKSEREMGAIRGAKIGLVVQNVRASLNPLIAVGSQMTNVYRVHLPMSKKEARDHCHSMLRSVGFREPEQVARQYPHELSGGMAQRVLLALVLGLSPTLIIADEPTSGLDATVQLEVLDLMSRLIRERHASSLLITHDFGVVARYCDTVAVMFGGRIVERAPTREFLSDPRHPYSVRLLAALGWSGPRSLPAPTGSKVDAVPLAAESGAGCNYATRCVLATHGCRSAEPDLRTFPGGREVRCFRADDPAWETAR